MKNNSHYEALVRYVDTDLAGVLTDEQREKIIEECMGAMRNAWEAGEYDAKTRVQHAQVITIPKPDPDFGLTSDLFSPTTITSPNTTKLVSLLLNIARDPNVQYAFSQLTLIFLAVLLFFSRLS